MTIFGNSDNARSGKLKHVRIQYDYLSMHNRHFYVCINEFYFLSCLPLFMLLSFNYVIVQHTFILRLKDIQKLTKQFKQ